MKSKKYILDYQKLQIGDIILESGHKPHSNLIKKYTKSNFSHAMICVGDMSIIHAEKAGVFSLNPQRLLVKHDTDLKVLRLHKKLSDSDKKKIVDFLRDKIGAVYSVKDALKVVLSKNPEAGNEYQFCSRLVSQAYKYIKNELVDNADFCSPADIEKSNLLYEVGGFINEASNSDIVFSLTRNVIKENEYSMYDWLNKTRDMAYDKYQEEIHKVNDVDAFLLNHPNEDTNVCTYVATSGYLDNYLVEVSNNPHMHNEEKFIRKYKDNITVALTGEYRPILSAMGRHINNYKNIQISYANTNLEYHNQQVKLYKNILGVILSKLITLFEVSKKMIVTGGINPELAQVFYETKNNIETLQDLGIKRYNN